MPVIIDGTNGVTTNSGTLISASTIGVGGTTPSTSGAGITFPATQSASTDANTLDDYEEGTWTPTDNSGAGLTLSVSSATYTKIGRVVFITCYVSYPSTSNGNSAAIGGLPFTVIANVYSECAVRTTAGYSSPFVYQINGGTTSGSFYQMVNGNTQPTNANLSGSPVLFHGFYFV